MSSSTINNTDGGDGEHGNIAILAKLSTINYVVFSITLAIPLVISISQALKSRHTSSDFMLASRSMSFIPVAVSAMASMMSAISVLGLPSEVYNHGIQYLLNMVSFVIACPIIAFVFIPIFYKLKVPSVHAYLERRFCLHLRKLVCAVYVLQSLFYLSIVVYAPSLAINAVSDIKLWISILIVSFLGIICSACGGMRAVIWTDCFQCVILFSGLVAVVSVAIHRTDGGFSHVWDVAKDHSKLEISFSIDPTQRLSFWSQTIGGTFAAMAMIASSQTSAQRFISAKSLRDAQYSVLFVAPLIILALTLLGAVGLVLFAYFVDHNLDPVASSSITSVDQILPFFVVYKLGFYGIPGLFFAALCSSTLSVLGSGLNSISTATVVDIESFLTDSLSDKRRTFIIRSLSVTYGLVIMGLAFFCSRMGDITPRVATILGAGGGPVLGVFLLGIFSKRANARGSLVGFSLGIILSLWMAIGHTVQRDYGIFILSRISFMWINAFSVLVTVTVGILVSLTAPAPRKNQLIGLVFGSSQHYEELVVANDVSDGDMELELL